jgi:hypothetical protein
VTFDRSHRAVLQSAVSALKRFLEFGYEKAYFIENHWHFLIGLFLTLAVMVGSGTWDALDQGSLPLFLFISLWLTIWTIAVAFLLVKVAQSWLEAIRSPWAIRKYFGALMLSLFALPFLAGEVLGFFFLAFQATSLPVAVLILLSIVITVVFYQLLQNVTAAGRAHLDANEGFQTFLEATEEDRLNYLNPPDRNPVLFEKYLPYALALDVEQRWAEQFTDVLAAEMAEGRTVGWYSGSSGGSFSPSSLASSLDTSVSTVGIRGSSTHDLGPDRLR